MKEIKWDFERAMKVTEGGTTWREPVQGITDIPEDAAEGESFYDLKADEEEKETCVWLCVGNGEVMQVQFTIGPVCPHCGK